MKWSESRLMSLEVEGIFFSYPKEEKQILQNIHISFRTGEIVAIVGANGSGKTTLTKLLVGVLRPSIGKIYVEGHDLDQMSIAEIGRYIGYVFQNPSQQIFCTSVQEEISYGLKNLRMHEEEIDSRVDYYLNYFQLSSYKQKFPLYLSQGEKQRLILAVILAMHPRYIILDEPTTGLDVYRRKLLGDYLLKIKADGCGVIFVSHEKKFVQTYADRIIFLKDGVIVSERGEINL
jgi:energy-coupling factor transport system ATP-binding protein